MTFPLEKEDLIKKRKRKRKIKSPRTKYGIMGWVRAWGRRAEGPRAEGESNPMEDGRNLQIPSKSRIRGKAKVMRDMKQG